MAVTTGMGKLHFLVLFLVISSSCLQVWGLQEFLGGCGLTIDLMLTTQNIQSGLLNVPMPESMDKYQDPARPMYCDIIITFTSGMNLLVELYFLDIMPKSSDIKTCSTGLEIFDQTGRKYYGGRICMEAWQWEERHREKQQEKAVVMNSPLTFRLISEGPYRGAGFKLHFNQFRPYWPCYIREFKCQQIQRCVHDDLTCDGWDDCGDFSDERIEAGCDLLTASEICSLIMGIVLLLGSVAQIVVFLIAYRRMSVQYGVRSESKIPIADEKYDMDSTFGIGRRYNSQDSIPSRFSRSTAHTVTRRDSDSDIVDKADLEKADRQELQPLTGSRMSNKTGDNMSERSYRSNPRKTIAQSLGSEVPSEPLKKSGQYSYSSRKGHSSSQSSLNRDKTELINGNVDAVDHNSLDKVRLGSRDRLSDRDRDKYSPNQRRSRGRDRYSDSDDYDDKDRYDDRRRRSSRERDRRRGDRYSDDDSDYDRDRRRRRSYDEYSDDSIYEYERERERRRRSRERYSRERYDDQDDSDTDRGRRHDDERDRDRRSYSKDSRERNKDRERYNDDQDDTDRGREKGRDSEKDKDRPSYRRDSRERDRERYRDTHDEDKGIKRSPHDDDRSGRRRRNEEKRRGPSAERDRLSGELSRNENKRSKSRESIQSKEKARQSPPLPLPPPYTEEDPIHAVQNQKPPTGESKRYSEQQNLPPPPPEVTRTEQQYPLNEDIKLTEPRIQKPSQPKDRQREPQIPKQPPSETDLKRLEQQNQKQPAKEIDEADRRKSNDDRRERYSRSRWTPKKKTEDSPPPEYEDVAPKSTFVGISYKEESV